METPEHPPAPDHTVDLSSGLPPYATTSRIAQGLVGDVAGQWSRIEQSHQQAVLAEQEATDRETQLIAEVARERAQTIGHAVLATYALRAAGIKPDTRVYDELWVPPDRPKVGRARRWIDSRRRELPEYLAPLPTRPLMFRGWEVDRRTDDKYRGSVALVLAHDGSLPGFLVPCMVFSRDEDRTWRFDQEREALGDATEQLRARKYSAITNPQNDVGLTFALKYHTDGTDLWHGYSPWEFGVRHSPNLWQRYLDDGVEPDLRSRVTDILVRHGIRLTLGSDGSRAEDNNPPPAYGISGGEIQDSE